MHAVPSNCKAPHGARVPAGPGGPMSTTLPPRPTALVEADPHAHDALAALAPDPAPPHPAPPPPREPPPSLDVSRGMPAAGMLLVNTPGPGSAISPPLEHAEWHGWT